MASIVGINTTEYERSAPSGGPLPPGVYVMTISRVQSKETNDKTGVYVEVEFDIQSPPEFGNRKFWDRFNIINKSQKAQQIGREGFADLAKACGIHGVINDDQEILGKTVQGRLRVKDSDNPQYPEPKNECRKYYPVGVNADEADEQRKGNTKNAPVAAQKANWGNAGQQPQQQIAPAATPQAPWKTK